MTTVLLASPYTPNNLGWGEDMDDLFSARLTRGQGAFTLHGHMPYLSLHLIAENIAARSTVLEYAHFDEFEAELGRGSYDFVGIQIKGVQTKKVARMIDSIRRLSPASKIVLGGYGIITLDDPMPNDPENLADYILSNVDYVCREEGVRFFRRVMGDEPVGRPITQYRLPAGKMTLNGLEDLLQIEIPSLLAALGCPNGCEFCATSAFFKKRKIQVADPYELFSFIKHQAKTTKGAMVPYISIFDEDFLLDVDYVRALGKLLKEDDEACVSRFFCFASLRAIEQYDGPEELADLGVASAWIGIESFEEEVISSEHAIGKRSCSAIEDTINGLYDHGIANTLSFIHGWDFHTPENIMTDTDRFIALKPVFYQIAGLTPCPGTELFRRMQEAGRIRESFTYEDGHIWKDEVFRLKNFDSGELRKYFDEAHRRLFETNGPSILGMAEANLNFYERYKDSPRHYMARRAETVAEGVRGMYPALPACVSLAPAEPARARAVKVLERHKRLFGEPSFGMKVAAAVFERVARREQRRWDEGTRIVVSDHPWVRTVYEPGREPVARQGPPRPHQLAERKKRREEERAERRRCPREAAGGFGVEAPSPV